MKTETVYNEFLELLTNNLPGQPDKPDETPQSTLEALWYFSCGTPRAAQGKSALPLPSLNRKSYVQLKALVQKRVKGTPLAHIIGKQQFMGLDLLVGSEALIPRKETEIVGYAALAKIKELAAKQPQVKIIDVCTGMGNLALAFATHEPKSKVTAIDISSDAVKLAQLNAQNLSLEDRVAFLAADMFEPVEKPEYLKSFDIITCNPPYISTKKLEKLPAEIIKHEPQEAFNGGPIGLSIIFKLIKESPRFLKTGGWLCFEVGLGQGDVISNVMSRNNQFSTIETAKDTQNNIRAILAQINH